MTETTFSTYEVSATQGQGGVWLASFQNKHDAEMYCDLLVQEGDASYGVFEVDSRYY